MSQEIVIGQIVEWEDGGTVLIRAALPSVDRAIDRKYADVEVGFNDGRHISPVQRRKAYALMHEIDVYMNGLSNADTLEDTKDFLKADFVFNHMQAMQRRLFSMSNVSVNTAADFITYLIDFIIRHDVPSSVSLIENCEDIQQYVYACGVHKKCCICGRPCEVHHEPPIGAGRDRKTINHLGMTFLPLCREHHTEIHSIGVQIFAEKYHVETVKIDGKIAKIYHLNTKENKHE